jgi:hypothetical protein
MHPFGGVDEELVPEIDADVDHPFRSAAPGTAPEKQQVAFLELAQIPVQRHLHSLPRLLAGVAHEVYAVEEEHRLGEAGAVKSFGRVAAPQVGPADKTPGRALDILRGGLSRRLPRVVVCGRFPGQATRPLIRQLHFEPVALLAGQDKFTPRRWAPTLKMARRLTGAYWSLMP